MARGANRRRSAALFGLSAVWLLLLCGSASAHAELKEAYPADGDALAEPPGQVQLLFNEPVEAEFSPMEVYDEEGDRVDEDDARVSPDNRKLIIVDLVEDLPEGPYTVEWRVASADGHPVEGACWFAVDTSAAGTGSPIQPVERSAERGGAGPASHYLHLVALGAGAVVLLALALRRRKKGGA